MALHVWAKILDRYTKKSFLLKETEIKTSILKLETLVTVFKDYLLVDKYSRNTCMESKALGCHPKSVLYLCVLENTVKFLVYLIYNFKQR